MLGSVFGAAAASVLGYEALATQGATETLQAAAARDGRFFGSAVRINELNAEAPLRQAVLHQCAHVVPEYEMNWNEIEPSYGQLAFEKMDSLAAFAGSNGKKVRGHTLLWHLGTPDWAVDMLRARRDWNLIARYFGSIMPRYGDVIDCWEVVNEPIDTGHRMDGLRENVFLEAFGPDYIRRALTQARIFAPHAQLMINEFGLEYDIPEQRDRRYLLLKLLERLKYAGAPLDTLGLQAHLDLRNGSVSQPSIATFVKNVADMGFTMIVTELDAKEAAYTASPQVRDRMVAIEVRRYLDVVLSHPAVKGVTTWGLSDLHSWLEVTKDDYARFPQAW
ncbi:MAG: endo-1,4-beta-xylanase, partial [Candidatus Eremiobacteraeota bacterium]|nr:endo-1,4-beta-xylanase [Candidatus Eremiobacteraeota bacterium]